MTQDNNFDQAMARRLAKLSTMPVDTTSLDRTLRTQVGPAPSARPVSWGRKLRPFAAVAASLLLVAIVGIAFLQNRPVHAAAIVQLHRDFVDGKVTTVQVSSMDEVNKAFKALECGAPVISSDGSLKPRCCCVGRLGNKKIPCVMLHSGATPVTMAWADKGDVRLPSSSPVTYNGESFHVQSHAGINLVMVQRGQHTLCVVGALPAEQLMALTEGLTF